MMVPDIANPFFTVMTRAVEDVARTAGFSVILCNTDEDADREQSYLRVAASDPVAGIIIVPSPAARMEWAVERGVAVVCVDRHAPHNEVDAVVVDNLAASTAATRLLFEAGYRRLACITGEERIETSEERLAGWAQAVRDHTGVDPDPELVLRARYVHDEDGEAATQQLMALLDPPDAIFAANNRLATGALRALHHLGLTPPTVGLVSFGGPPHTLFPLPGLITTYLPAADMGSTAAHMLLERINGLDSPPRSVTLPVTMQAL
jgi:LacI family transcriptional regulator